MSDVGEHQDLPETPTKMGTALGWAGKTLLQAAAVLTAAVLATAGFVSCNSASPQREESVSAAPAAPPVIPAGAAELSTGAQSPSPDSAPVAGGDAPLWVADRFVGSGLSGVGAVTPQLFGDLVLVSAREGQAAGISVLAAATGELLWSIAAEQELPGGMGAVLWDQVGVAVADPTGLAEPAVIVQFFRSGCTDGCSEDAVSSEEPAQTDERGVAALSAADGHVLWMVAAIPATPSDVPDAERVRDLTMTLVGASEVAVVVTTTSKKAHAGGLPDPDSRTVGLDPMTGTQVWSVTGVQPRHLAGEVFLGTRADSGAPTATATFGAVVALDLRTGVQRWATGADFPVADVYAASSSTVLALSLQDNQIHSRLLNVQDGGTVLDLPGVNLSCVAGDDVLACAVPVLGEDDQLLTVVAGEALPVVGATRLTQDIRAVVGGTVYAGNLDGSNVEAVDRSGTVTQGGLAGIPVAQSDTYLVLVRPDDTVVVYANSG